MGLEREEGEEGMLGRLEGRTNRSATKSVGLRLVPVALLFIVFIEEEPLLLLLVAVAVFDRVGTKPPSKEINLDDKRDSRSSSWNVGDSR